jgi:hypothetical protein
MAKKGGAWPVSFLIPFIIILAKSPFLYILARSAQEKSLLSSALRFAFSYLSPNFVALSSDLVRFPDDRWKDSTFLQDQLKDVCGFSLQRFIFFLITYDGLFCLGQYIWFLSELVIDGSLSILTSCRIYFIRQRVNFSFRQD